MVVCNSSNVTIRYWGKSIREDNSITMVPAINLVPSNPEVLETSFHLLRKAKAFHEKKKSEQQLRSSASARMRSGLRKYQEAKMISRMVNRGFPPFSWEPSDFLPLYHRVLSRFWITAAAK